MKKLQKDWIWHFFNDKVTSSETLNFAVISFFSLKNSLRILMTSRLLTQNYQLFLLAKADDWLNLPGILQQHKYWNSGRKSRWHNLICCSIFLLFYRNCEYQAECLQAERQFIGTVPYWCWIWRFGIYFLSWYGNCLS